MATGPPAFGPLQPWTPVPQVHASMLVHRHTRADARTQADCTRTRMQARARPHASTHRRCTRLTPADGAGGATWQATRAAAGCNSEPAPHALKQCKRRRKHCKRRKKCDGAGSAGGASGASGASDASGASKASGVSNASGASFVGGAGCKSSWASGARYGSYACNTSNASAVMQAAQRRKLRKLCMRRKRRQRHKRHK
jgi:hypothetical protein